MAKRGASSLFIGTGIAMADQHPSSCPVPIPVHFHVLLIVSQSPFLWQLHHKRPSHRCCIHSIQTAQNANEQPRAGCGRNVFDWKLRQKAQQQRAVQATPAVRRNDPGQQRTGNFWRHISGLFFMMGRNGPFSFHIYPQNVCCE